MKKAKQILFRLPEYLLIAAVIFYWSSAGSIINPIAIGLVLILILQIIIRNRIIGLLIPILLILTCIFLSLALASEINEFPIFNAEAKRLLLIGLTYLTSTIFISGLISYKYSNS
jgi:hypothetical protein